MSPLPPTRTLFLGALCFSAVLYVSIVNRGGDSLSNDEIVSVVGTKSAARSNVNSPAARRAHPERYVSALGDLAFGTSTWKNDYNLVHVVSTEFMHHQSPLVHLNAARLDLFETFTLPSMLQQSNDQFLWLIWTDANIRETPVGAAFLKLMETHFTKNQVIVLGGAQEVPGHNLRTLYGYADSWSTLSKKILYGNPQVLADYYQQSKTHLLLETQLDADDALSADFVESVQVSASVTQGQQPDRVGQVETFCPESHIEWRYYPADDEEQDLDAEGQFVHVKNPKHCIQSGSTVSFHLEDYSRNLRPLKPRWRDCDPEEPPCIETSSSTRALKELWYGRRRNERQPVKNNNNKNSLRHLEQTPRELFGFGDVNDFCGWAIGQGVAPEFLPGICFFCLDDFGGGENCTAPTQVATPTATNIYTWDCAALGGTSVNSVCSFLQEGEAEEGPECPKPNQIRCVGEEYNAVRIDVDDTEGYFEGSKVLSCCVENCGFVQEYAITWSGYDDGSGGALETFEMQQLYDTEYVISDLMIFTNSSQSICQIEMAIEGPLNDIDAGNPSVAITYEGLSLEEIDTCSFRSGSVTTICLERKDEEPEGPICRRQLKMLPDEQDESGVNTIRPFKAAVLMAKTATAAGMKNVLPGKSKSSGTSNLPASYIQSTYRGQNGQDKAWEEVERDFGVSKDEVTHMKERFENNMEAILIDSFAGQCSPGHSCKESTKRALGQLLDHVQHNKKN